MQFSIGWTRVHVLSFSTGKQGDALLLFKLLKATLYAARS